MSTSTSFAPPLSPLTARRPRFVGHVENAGLRNAKRRSTTMILRGGVKLRLNSGLGALSAAIALSLTRIPGVVTPDFAPTSTSVALAERVTTKSNTLQPSSLATVLVARQSLQDLGDAPKPSASEHTITNNDLLPNEDGEFALSVRLCTACALGVLMGSEMGATALALGMRALVVISLTSCLGTIYALLPPGAETTFLVQVVPPFAAPFVASAISLLGLLLFNMVQSRLSRRYLLARRQRLTRSAMTCGVVASAAGTGAACAAGQALPAVMFYLIALAICRSVPLPRARGRKTRRRRTLARELATVTSNNGIPDRHVK